MSKSNSKIVTAVQTLNSILEKIPYQCHLKLDICNDFILPADWGFEGRVNPNFHVALVKSGNGSYILGEDEEGMEKGKIIFVSDGFSHGRNLDLQNLPRIALVRFSIVDNFTRQSLRREYSPFAFAYIPRNKTRFYALFDDLIRNYRYHTMDFSIKICNSILTQIVFEIYQDLNNCLISNMEDARLKKATEYMERNIYRNISIEEIADYLGLSENYFRTIFRSQYGMNPKQYFIELKIRHAYQLLLETDLKIKVISQRLGYSDPYVFSKQFRSVMGKSPIQVKKKCT